MENNKYTPKTIAESSYLFSIPLYQRLFEWGEEQIVGLMNDLYSSYKQVNSKPYYIGLLTAYYNKDNNYDLVDGQQRFTVLMLMAIAFKWDKFMKKDDKIRLSFFARPKDAEYLKNKVKSIEDNEYVNTKMEKGIEFIRQFVDKKVEEKDKEDFINYIYKHLTFFISELPEEYELADMNKHFEAMNGTGKGLENYEILKVKLLKKITVKGIPDSKEKYTRIWNTVSQMDKPLIRQRTNEGSDIFVERYRQALLMGNIKNVFESERGKCLINDFYKTSDSESEDQSDEKSKTIKDIASSQEKPSTQIQSEGDRAILSFSEFLLEVLYITIDKTLPDGIGVTDFFDTNKLQTTFEQCLKDDKVETFLDNLLHYRLLFDYYVIHVGKNDASYELEFKEGVSIDNVIQYQAMLYVNSSSKTYYLWLTDLLNHVDTDKDVTSASFLNELKEKDNTRHPFDDSKLTYGSIDRYWFWRLDYYLWENRTIYFKVKSLEIANNYVFRKNRSIEHIAPQTPQKESSIKWNENGYSEELMNSFGNLAMISSGQNSALQNESFEVKKAYVESFIKGSKIGTIESLKMLIIYQYDKWDKDNIEKHREAMIKVLKDSY